MLFLTGDEGSKRTFSRDKQIGFVLCFLLVVATCAVYSPVRHYPFVDIDDGLYVYDNPHITGPFNWSTVKWAFTHGYGDNYAPVDSFTHILNVHLFKLNAGYHHDMNVALHVLSVILLFLALRRATGFTGRSLMVAALFALHPINVENVAWVAEQKTMLSSVFFFLALGAYHWYALNPNLRRMAVVTGLYGIGLLAKAQIITLPFVLLLWDWWPLGRMFRSEQSSPAAHENDRILPRSFRALLIEKIPMFVIACIVAGLTMYAQRMMQKVLILPFSIRLGNSVLSYARFIGKAFWPDHLALLYLHPGYALPWTQVWLALVFLIAVSAFVAAQRKHRYLVVGWLWFLGTMVPTIGLVQVDLHALADRYAYIAFIGLFIMVCWGISEWAGRIHLPQPALPVMSVMILLILSVLTYRQVGVWSDRFTLWQHTLAVTHRNWAADFRLGNDYLALGQDEKALAYYRQAAEDVPQNPFVNLNIALIEHRRRNFRQAIEFYQKVLAFSKDSGTNAQVLANMGHAYGDLGDYDKARECFQEARRLYRPAQTSVN